MKVATPTFQLYYGNKMITNDVSADLISLTYHDYLSSQSDELSVTLTDSERKWIGSWFPTQGDELRVMLGYQGEPLVDLGAFEIDEIEWRYEARLGSVVSIRALSTGISKANRTLKPKAYENTHLADIVRQVAKNLDLIPTGTVANIPIKRITQYQERDVEFLTRLAIEYNHSFKIVGKKLVFTTMKSLETRSPVAVIDFSMVKSLQLRDRILAAVKKVTVSGLNTDLKKSLSAEKIGKGKRPNQKQAKATNADTLKIVARGESQTQMQARAEAALAQQTDEQQAGRITLIGHPKLVAGNTITLTNLGLFSGKYLIKSARHHLTRKEGYTTDIEVRMLAFLDT